MSSRSPARDEDKPVAHAHFRLSQYAGLVQRGNSAGWHQAARGDSGAVPQPSEFDQCRRSRQVECGVDDGATLSRRPEIDAQAGVREDRAVLIAWKKP